MARPKVRRFTCKVSFDWPEGATVSDLKAYVAAAVTAWGGSLTPPFAYGEDDKGDLCFGLRKNVKVVKIG